MKFTLKIINSYVLLHSVLEKSTPKNGYSSSPLAFVTIIVKGVCKFNLIKNYMFIININNL
jgi:hypothetical protein